MLSPSPIARELSSHTFPRGVFTLSLDFELIWGTIDKPNWSNYLALCETERQEVIGRLLTLFDRYKIRASWCTVGHLFLDSCNGQHCELPKFSRDVRSTRDPGSDEQSKPLFYGRQLLAQIQRCPTPQEIGSHSFTHVIFDTIDRARAEAELEACTDAASRLGIQLKSFVFPRNRVAHTSVLPRYGFTIYRTPEPVWHEATTYRRWTHRIGNLASVLLMTTPPAVLPTRDMPGLCSIPGSMLWTPSHRARRFLPILLRVRRARKGLERAAREKRVFHLWFHPTDMVQRQDAMFEGLERTLELAAGMRERRLLDFLSMGEIADRVLADTRAASLTLEAAG